MDASGLKKQAHEIVDNWNPLNEGKKQPEKPTEFIVRPDAPRPARKHQDNVSKYVSIAVLGIWAMFILWQ